MNEFLPLFPEQASTMAGRVDALYFFLVAVSAFFTVLIAVALVVFAVRFRRRSEDEVPPDVHAPVSLEIIWTAIPFGLAMVMFFWGASVYFSMRRPPTHAEEVFVVAKQWMWRFQHADGRREINELHVPLGQAVKLTMTSEDVIHSFFVPAFRTKQDLLPNRFTTAWFEATRPGRYHLFCAEYCGTQHSLMKGSIVVMEPAEYQEWLAGGPPAQSPQAAGEALFSRFGCNTCHLKEESARGPQLAGLIGKPVTLESGETIVADEEYVRESILNPQAKVVKGFLPIMPTFKGQVTEEQVLQLIAYLKSLEAGGGAEQAQTAPSE